MKTIFTLLLFTLCTFGVRAQMTDAAEFEDEEDISLWTIFSNGGSSSADDMTIVANPSPNSVNASANVLQFIVHPDASPWAGAFSDSYGPMEFTKDAHTLVMMVLKTKISPCVLKLENSSDGGANQEVKVENTLTDEWELLSFDLSAAIGHTYARLTMFPDFPDSRTEGTTVLIDYIAVEGFTSFKNFKGSVIKTYPNPADMTLYVQHSGMTSLKIKTITGQDVHLYKFPMSNTKLIDIQSLKSGIYILTVSSKEGEYTTRFIKK